MFNCQMNYWNDMADMLQETYKASFKSGEQFQEGFTSMLKKIVETNIKNTMELQKEIEKANKKSFEQSFEQVKKFNVFYSENAQKSIDTLKELCDKYGVKNEQFKDEMVKLWKENFETYEKKVNDLTGMLKDNQEKSLEGVFDTFKNYSKNVEEFNKKLEEMTKSK